jgi:hypothetical protein
MPLPPVRATTLALFLPLLCDTLSLRSQADRYELGLRLRAFERRLEATEDATRRNAALDRMKRIVQAFFGNPQFKRHPAPPKPPHHSGSPGGARDGAKRTTSRPHGALPEPVRLPP